MAKILITGGLGNIGSRLAYALVKQGHDVIIYDYKKDISSVAEIKNKITIINGDIRNYENLKHAIIGITGVVHLAAVSRVVWGYERPRETIDININGTANILETARVSVNKPWIIFGSSREVYGNPDMLPCPESVPKKIANVYGATKISGEYLLEQYHQNYGLSGLTFRFSNVYGSKFDQLDRVIPKFLLNASNNLPLIVQGGKQVFDFTHIDDTITGILAGIEYLMKSENKGESVYNDFHLVTGIPTSFENLINSIKELFISPITVNYVPSRHYDVELFYGDPAKSKNILGFEAKISIEQGLKLFINEMRDYLGEKNPVKPEYLQ